VNLAKERSWGGVGGNNFELWIGHPPERESDSLIVIETKALANAYVRKGQPLLRKP